MEFPLKGARGVFTPDQVRKMQLRMDDEGAPNESLLEQERRAAQIVREEETGMGFASDWY